MGEVFVRSSVPWKERVKALKRETFTLYLPYRHPRVPWVAKALALLIVGYALSPIDLIPDFIPVLGYLDDLVLIPLGNHDRHPNDPGGGPCGMPPKSGDDSGTEDTGGKDRGRGDHPDLDSLGGCRPLVDHKDCQSPLKRPALAYGEKRLFHGRAIERTFGNPNVSLAYRSSTQKAR